MVVDWQDKSLHTELALICVDQVLMHLRDDTVWKLWRAKGTSLFFSLDTQYSSH